MENVVENVVVIKKACTLTCSVGKAKDILLAQKVFMNMKINR